MNADAEYLIERLSGSHALEGFACGEPELDRYLHRFARANQESGYAHTYVAVRRGSREVLSYYTLSSASIASSTVPEPFLKGMPRYPVPAILIGKLARHVSEKGKGLGEILLLSALWKAFLLSRELGVRAVVVDALNERARQFYRAYGFEPLLDDDLHLFLPLKVVARLFGTE